MKIEALLERSNLPTQADPDMKPGWEIFYAWLDIILLTGLTGVYIISMILLTKRQDFQPLKSRSTSLILLSTIGNYGYFTCLMFNKVVSNNYWGIWDDINKNHKQLTWTERSLIDMTCYMSMMQFWLFRPMWFFAYFFRAFRLNAIWNVHASYLKMRRRGEKNMDKDPNNQSRMKWIQQRNLIKWLLITLTPFLVLILISPFYTEVTMLLPFLGVQQCDAFTGASYYRVLQRSMISMIASEAILNGLFFITIFMLRGIHDEFDISAEIRYMVLLRMVFDFPYLGMITFFNQSYFVVLGNLEYLQLGLCLTLLYMSTIDPIKKTYLPNNIIPFPLNEECINNMDSAMIMPTSSKYFFDFLYEELEDEKGLALFALYADLRRYLLYCGDHAEKDLIVDCAETILNDYIQHDSEYTLPDNQIVLSLRSRFKRPYDTLPRHCNAALFEDLYHFCTGGLEIYYDSFMQSQRFKVLKKEVEKQEVLYHVLRTFDLIEN